MDAAETLTIALASPRVATSLDDGLGRVTRLVAEAAARGAEIVCFPEAYLPGLRGVDLEVLRFDAADHARVLAAVAAAARTHGIAVIFCTERVVAAGREIAAYVFDADGGLQGVQTKNQLDPSEDAYYVPGSTRTLFSVKGVRFGVVICHEGWRYPETVRWAAARGAAVVFQPQHTGHEREGTVPMRWGAPENAYYEQAMLMRSRENGIFFASVNYALRFPESATSVTSPDGECVAFLPYGEEGVLVHTLRPAEATGLLARRFAPERLEEASPTASCGDGDTAIRTSRRT